MEKELVINVQQTQDLLKTVDVARQYLPQIKRDTKHYLGDVKWVLYQYICDMNDSNISIRCGRFAFDKLVRMESTIVSATSNFTWNINGEKLSVYLINELDKKQMILSNEKFEEKTIGKFSSMLVHEGKNLDSTIYPNDIVLYFA